MTAVNSDERVVVERSSVNIADIIAALALLLAMFGVLRYFGVPKGASGSAVDPARCRTDGRQDQRLNRFSAVGSTDTGGTTPSSPIASRSRAACSR